MLSNDLFKLSTAYLTPLHLSQPPNYPNNHLTNLKLPQIPSHPILIKIFIGLDVPVKHCILLD